MECIIPLNFLLNNEKNEKMRQKIERALKIRDELLKILEREKMNITEYPDGLYDLNDKRNLSPTKKKLAEGRKEKNYGNLTRAKSARLLRELREKQKSGTELLRDLKNFHKKKKHRVRKEHNEETIFQYHPKDLSEAKSQNIYLERKIDHERTGYLSPSVRSKLPLKMKKEKRFERARSALPLRNQRNIEEIQTDRPSRRPKIEGNRFNNDSFRLNPTPTTNTRTRETSPGYSVKLSYSHYNPISDKINNTISPRKEKIVKKRKLLEEEKKKGEVIRKKEEKKKKKKILKFVYQDKAQGDLMRKKKAKRIESALKNVKIGDF